MHILEVLDDDLGVEWLEVRVGVGVGVGVGPLVWSFQVYELLVQAH